MLAVIVWTSWKVTSSVLRLDVCVVWFYCRKVNVLLPYFFTVHVFLLISVGLIMCVKQLYGNKGCVSCPA